MSELLVRGLQSEGPGDIVGAFVNEAGVSPDDIGNIDIEGKTAVVEVDEDVVEQLCTQMDGNRIGSTAVSVTEIDERTAQLRAYTAEQSERVELEREAEINRHQQEIRRLSGRERQEKGRAILNLTGRDEGETVSGHAVKFVHQDGPLPDTEIAVGDLVMLSKQDPLRDDNPTGTVTQVTTYAITVSFDHRPQDFVFGSGLRMDLYVDDTTFQRMRTAIDRLYSLDADKHPIRDTVIGIQEPNPSSSTTIDSWHNKRLNKSQQNAVQQALGNDDIHLIHGPPGTGKTTTVIEVIRQAINRDQAVLATAPSNTAVDNIVERLADGNVDVVRVGHPARVNPLVEEQTLDVQLAEHEDYRRAKQLREEAMELVDQQDSLTAPSGRWRRGLSDQRIKQLAEQGRGSRGIPPERITEMAEWLELQDNIDSLFANAEQLEEQAIADIIDTADVVCTTNSTAGSDILDGHEFDLVVIDEATQATEPACLIPIVKGRTVVMAGDHRQLPPTVQSQQAADRGLSTTLFERLAEHHGHIRTLLATQYRMHEQIMEYASRQFYEDTLRAAQSVASHSLADLGISEEQQTAQTNGLAVPPSPTVFIDTKTINADERQREGSPSYENPAEATIVGKLVAKYIAAGLDPGAIGIISPYDDQQDRIITAVEKYHGSHPEELEISTVDGFQGREKELIVVSLVRSNPHEEVGFLTESRRFNVAVTRARRKVIVIGDSKTVGTVPAINAYINWTVNTGGYHQLGN